jgi:hypothetical protein
MSIHRYGFKKTSDALDYVIWDARKNRNILPYGFFYSKKEAGQVAKVLNEDLQRHNTTSNVVIPYYARPASVRDKS